MKKSFKRVLSSVLALVVSAAAIPAINTNDAAVDISAASDYNYAEALQKSMFFYEVQQAGKLPEWNYVQWKGDSMCDEDGNETDVCTGGWFDAGDHFKFTLTNAYSASVIGWGYIQYKDAVDKAGLGEVYRNNIQWALDFLMQCDRGDKIIGTIGDFEGGSTDHNIWCSSEVYMRKHYLNNGDWVRPYDEIADSTTMALSAAALAEGYIIFKDTQPDKAKAYLEQAEKYFKTADKIRDNENGAMGSMYNPSSWVDDCMYAANWLYMATGDKSYLDKCETDYVPLFPTENQSTDRKYTWGFCWDDTTQGAALLYAINTGKQEWIDHIAHHLAYWDEGYGGKRIEYTPDGLAYLMNWGSLRHASNTAWIAMLAADTIFKDDAASAEKYNKWAKGQMDYAFGDNALGLCYVLGMGDKNPTAIHHRTASGIHDDHWNDLGQEASSEGWQTEYAHTLYGALVGGPNSSGEYTNNVSQYEYSEVAIDYNAGFTAALCAMVDDYGGSILSNFPEPETPKWAEWKIAAVLNNGSDSKTEVKAWAMNHTAWPARVEKNIYYRYYFDITETLQAGLTIDQIKVECGSQQYQEGEQGYATASGPHHYDGNIYYAEIKFEDARAIQPTGQSEHRDEVQFRIVIPDAIDGKSTKGAWDPTNDWSYEGLDATSDIKSADALNDHITMYVNDVLVWGIEPDGTKPSDDPYEKPEVSETTTSTTTEDTSASETTEDTTVRQSETTTSETEVTVSESKTDDTSAGGNDSPTQATLLGDVTNDGQIDIKDVALLAQYVVKLADLDEQQYANANVIKDNSVDIKDLSQIKRYLIKEIKKF